MDLPGAAPADIDLSRPGAARVYDYFLGRAHNFEIDRQLAEQIGRMTRTSQTRCVTTEITLRSRAAITSFFGDFTIIEPGVVHIPLWRPGSPSDVDDKPERFGAFGGVGRNDRPAG